MFSRSSCISAYQRRWSARRSSGSARAASCAKWRAWRVADRLQLARLLELLEPVLAQGLEHPVARRHRAGHDLQQRAIDQRGEAVERVGLVAPRTRCSTRRAGAEDRQPPREPALGLVQQVPAPVDDGAQRAVARERGAAAAGEQPEAVVQALGELADRQRAQPRRGQLEREREAVQAAADLLARRVVHHEAGQRGRARGRRTAPARERLGPAAGTATRLSPEIASASRLVATRRSFGQPREQPVGELGHARDQVLAVVEHDDRLAVGEHVEQAPEPVARAPAPRAARPRAARARRAPRATMSTSDVTGASSTIQTPSATRSTQPATASRASRVLPAPPGPSSVTSRPRSSSSPIWAISRSRPTKLVTGADRFERRLRRLLASAGRPCARPAAPAPGRDAELVGEQRAHALVGGQRVGLAAGGGERRDQLRREPLVQRVLGAQRLELGDEPVAVAEREVGLDAVGERREPQIVQPRPRPPRRSGSRRGRRAPARATAPAPRAGARRPGRGRRGRGRRCRRRPGARSAGRRPRRRAGSRPARERRAGRCRAPGAAARRATAARAPGRPGGPPPTARRPAGRSSPGGPASSARQASSARRRPPPTATERPSSCTSSGPSTPTTMLQLWQAPMRRPMRALLGAGPTR